MSTRLLAVLAAIPLVLAAAPSKKKAAGKAPPAATATAAATPTEPPLPSLRESVEFLSEKVETYGSYTYDVTKADAPPAKGKVTGSLRLGSFDEKSCVLELRRQVALETRIEGDDPHGYSEFSDINLKVPLRDLDPKKITLDPLPRTFRKVYDATGKTESYLQISFVAKNDKKPIKATERRRIEEGDGADKKTDSADLNDLIGSSYMLFSDPDIAERAHKAFSRAVELCQKKKEAF